MESADGQPVVVKSTETEEGMTRLASETDRLDRAAHPGVVEVLDRDDGRLVLAWAGGQTLASYQAPFPQLAAVFASLSATVADLHDLGIVHGMIQADHVIIGADGRPRLCSFGGPVGRIDRVGPADDVAAMGRLITDLLGEAAEIEPIPDRRWGRRRWSGYLRRALLTLADQATDTDAAHRPTARTLAASIADAVPDARIEPAPMANPSPMPNPAPSVPSTERPGPEREDVASERAADGAGPVADEMAAPAPGTDSEPRVDARPTEMVSGAPFLVVDHPAPTAEDDPDPASEDGSASTPTVLGLRTVGADPGESTSDGDVDRLRPAPRRDPTRARPIRPVRPWRTVAAVGAAAAVLVALGLAVRPDAGHETLTTQAPAGQAPTSASSGPGPPTDAGTTPRTAPAADPDCIAVSGPAADVDGDGCAEAVSVDATFIDAGRQTFEVGQSGDALSLGDWNCDGQVTPGLVRPGTGEIFLFESWPDGPTGITVDASTVVPDAERLDPGPTDGPCAPPTVVLRGGGRRSLDRPEP